MSCGCSKNKPVIITDSEHELFGEEGLTTGQVTTWPTEMWTIEIKGKFVMLRPDQFAEVVG